MALYLAMQIIKGKLSYEKVMTKYSEYKDEIDTILIGEGREDLITQ